MIAIIHKMSSLEQLIRDGILDKDFLQLGQSAGAGAGANATVTYHSRTDAPAVDAPGTGSPTPSLDNQTADTTVDGQQVSPLVPGPPTQQPALADLTYYHNVAYHWLYSSPHYGWWHFAKDDNEQLEAVYTQKQPGCQLNINGQTYMVDFHRMTQKGIGKSRQLLRVTDMANIALKGVAGTHIGSHAPLPRA